MNAVVIHFQQVSKGSASIAEKYTAPPVQNTTIVELRGFSMNLSKQTFCEIFVEGRGNSPCPNVNFCCRTCHKNVNNCPKVAFLEKNHPGLPWQTCKYAKDKTCPYEMTFGQMAMEILKRRVFSDV